jgi:hypothetical protein
MDMRPNFSAAKVPPRNTSHDPLFPPFLSPPGDMDVCMYILFFFLPNNPPSRVHSLVPLESGRLCTDVPPPPSPQGGFGICCSSFFESHRTGSRQPTPPIPRRPKADGKDWTPLSPCHVPWILGLPTKNRAVFNPHIKKGGDSVGTRRTEASPTGISLKKKKPQPLQHCKPCHRTHQLGLPPAPFLIGSVAISGEVAVRS